MSDISTPTPSRRLGRGLTALLGGGAPAHEETNKEVTSELISIAVAQITRSPFQPRKEFDPESLGELSASIKEHGVLQPILVREIDGGYQLIAGERRWQAAQKAGLTKVPCRILDVIDKTACEFALEENLKRKDLNDLEKAQAFRDYLKHFECTVEELAKQLSMSRSAISNMMRLLELPDPIQRALHTGKLTAGHARSLLPLPIDKQLEMMSRIQAEQLSVRATEAAVKTLLGRDQTPAVEAPLETATPVATASSPVTSEEATTSPQMSQPVSEASGSEMLEEIIAAESAHQAATESPNEAPATLPIQEAETHRTSHVESLEGQLRDLLGVQVKIQLDSKASGKISIPFSNNDEFERVLRLLRRASAA